MLCRLGRKTMTHDSELMVCVCPVLIVSVLMLHRAELPHSCDLCGRRFKNLPALNGHMRLHGGYYKKVAFVFHLFMAARPYIFSCRGFFFFFLLFFHA